MRVDEQELRKLPQLIRSLDVVEDGGWVAVAGEPERLALHWPDHTVRSGRSRAFRESGLFREETAS